MDFFFISTLLKDFNKVNRRGLCNSCNKIVSWSKAAVASHKRVSCEGATEEEKRKFAKRPSEGAIHNNLANSRRKFKCKVQFKHFRYVVGRSSETYAYHLKNR